MSLLSSLGFGARRHVQESHPGTEFVMMQRPLQRLLAFRGRNIDDVVNDPIVKNEMLGYWKVLNQIERGSERVELEKQWNSLGRRI